MRAPAYVLILGCGSRCLVHSPLRFDDEAWRATCAGLIVASLPGRGHLLTIHYYCVWSIKCNRLRWRTTTK